jgi:predicted metal-dependent peptidase
MEMKGELSRIKSTLVRVCPFVASMLMRARIATMPRFPPPHEDCPAGVRGDGTLFISEEQFGKFDFREKTAVLCHEALHLALLHHERVGEREGEVWNLAADAVVNKAVEELSLPLPKGAVKGERLEVKDWEKMSTEELYEELLKRVEVVKVPIDLFGRSELGGAGEGGCSPSPQEGEGKGSPSQGKVRVVQEGDPSLYDPSAGKEELERRWKEAIAAALMAQKTAGKLPVGVERLFDEVLKPKVNIKALFRQAIRSGLGRMVVSDWTRPSRKNPDLPGVKRLTIPSIFALVDTSGSIGEKELSLFVGTVLEFAGQTKVQVICWDAEAYEPVKLRNRSVEPLKGKMKGGGGTVIRPALEKTLKQMRPLDMVAILSDFEILDWDEPKTQELLSKVAARASVAVLLSTYKEVSAPRWRFLRLH